MSEKNQDSTTETSTSSKVQLHAPPTYVANFHNLGPGVVLDEMVSMYPQPYLERYQIRVPTSEHVDIEGLKKLTK